MKNRYFLRTRPSGGLIRVEKNNNVFQYNEKTEEWEQDVKNLWFRENFIHDYPGFIEITEENAENYIKKITRRNDIENIYVL